MNIKAVVKYGLKSVYGSILGYYGIMFTILLAFEIISMTVAGSFKAISSGTEFGSLIFLFVVSLNFFKKNFEFFQLNGVSRKTQFYGFLFTTGIIAFAMNIIDNIYMFIGSKYMSYMSAYYMLYNTEWTFSNGLVGRHIKFNNFNPENLFFFLQRSIWTLLSYILIISIGYCIALFYNRVSKRIKILVSVGVPVFFWGLTTFDVWKNNANINKAFWSFAGKTFGFSMSDPNPNAAIATFLVLILLISGISYSLIRRVPIR